MTRRRIPESLLGPDLAPIWEAARRKLDRFGPQRRGPIPKPDLSPAGALTLESLLGRKPPQRLDLTELEEALAVRQVGNDLCSALTRLGHPPSDSATKRRAERTRSRQARTALRNAVASWDELWANKWADGIVKSGLIAALDSREVGRLVADVRRLLDRIDRLEPSGISRTELAVQLYGSAHALDRGEKRAAFVTHALRHQLCTPEEREPLGERELWEAAGILADRVSAPALTWSLPAVGTSPLDEQIRAASDGALPLHISLLALLRHPVAVARRTPVLVVENPRLVEAAAERHLAGCVVSSNGNPSTAVTTLMGQLLRSGASIWYHGDFDAPGIAICRRMHETGCTPWMMDARHYEAAVRLAEFRDVRLERDARECGATPWDPMLQEAFGRRRLIVHEEFLIDGVLDEFPAIGSRDDQ